MFGLFRDTLNVVDELKATVGSLEREDGMGSIKVEVMDPNVAEIYAKSPRSHVSGGAANRWSEAWKEYSYTLCCS